MKVVLEVNHVSKNFYSTHALTEVSFDLREGEVLALAGENGAGKSTFLKLLMQEEMPTAGKIKFGPSVKMAYLPQIIHFSHPERSVLDTMIPGKARGQFSKICALSSAWASW